MNAIPMTYKDLELGAMMAFMKILYVKRVESVKCTSDIQP